MPGANNPFNIKYDEINNPWEGQIGESGGFAEFETLRHGIRAGDITMENYGKLHGINTLEGAISRWAPPSDNNPTQNYIDFVSSRTRISPTQELDLNDPRIRANILSAMADFENEGNNNVAVNAIIQSRRSVPVEDVPPAVNRTDQAITAFIAPSQQRREYASTQAAARSTQVASRPTQTASRPTQVAPRRARLSESELGQKLNFGRGAAYREEVLASPGVINIPEPDEPLVIPPGSLSESFRRGAGAGLQGLRADMNYLRAIGNLFVGDEEGAAAAVERAAMNKEQAAEITAGSETFEEFINEPTFGGFMHQAAQTIGQVTPFFAETFAGLLMGGTGGFFAKAGINVVQKQTAKKLLKDLVTKKSKSKVEQELLEDLYTVARRNYFEGAGKYVRRGMMGGAFAAEYPIMTGEHFGEFDEAGVELNISRSLQAMGMGVPSAFIGAAGETMLLNRIGRNFTKVATKTAAGKTSGLLATLAKNVGKGAGQQAFTEGLTETLQEGLLVGQRLATDENYAREEILMRLGHSAFAGALAGGFTGGTGGVLTTIPNALRSGQQTAASVKPKVARMIGAARQQQVDNTVDTEKYGTDGYTSAPEASRDIDAQIQAVIDGIKPAAFHEGGNAHELTPNVITPIEDESGQSAPIFALYVKDRGTLYSSDSLILETFQRNLSATPGNTEALLAAALGYSAEKPDNADTVIQVRNIKTGAIISEELTSSFEQDPKAHDAAVAAANVFINKGNAQGVKLGGRKLSLDEALVERKQRFDAEEVIVRGMNIVGSADTLGLPMTDAEAADARVLVSELTKIIALDTTLSSGRKIEGEFSIEAIENAKRVRAIAEEKLAIYDEALAEKNKAVDRRKIQKTGEEGADVVTDQSSFKVVEVDEEGGAPGEDAEAELELKEIEFGEDLPFKPEQIEDQPKLPDKKAAKLGLPKRRIVYEQSDVFAPRKDPKRIFVNKSHNDTTESLRKRYEELVPRTIEGAKIDWEKDEEGLYTDTVLRHVITLIDKYKQQNVEVVPDPDSDGYKIQVLTTPDTKRYKTTKGRELTLEFFIEAEVENALTSKEEFKKISLAIPTKQNEDGTWNYDKREGETANIAMLIKAGQRINETDSGRQFIEGGSIQSLFRGLNTILLELVERGYRFTTLEGHPLSELYKLKYKNSDRYSAFNDDEKKNPNGIDQDLTKKRNAEKWGLAVEAKKNPITLGLIIDSLKAKKAAVGPRFINISYKVRGNKEWSTAFSGFIPDLENPGIPSVDGSQQNQFIADRKKELEEDINVEKISVKNVRSLERGPKARNIISEAARRKALQEDEARITKKILSGNALTLLEKNRLVQYLKENGKVLEVVSSSAPTITVPGWTTSTEVQSADESIESFVQAKFRGRETTGEPGTFIPPVKAISETKAYDEATNQTITVAVFGKEAAELNLKISKWSPIPFVMNLKTTEENVVTTYRIVDMDKAEIANVSESFEKMARGNTTELTLSQENIRFSEKELKRIGNITTSIAKPVIDIDDSTDFTRFVTSTLRRLKIKMGNIEIVRRSEIENLTPQELDRKFRTMYGKIFKEDRSYKAWSQTLADKPNRIIEIIKREIKILQENPEQKGRYISTKDIGHLIIVDDIDSTNALELHWAVGHELGHAFYNDSVTKALDNPKLRQKLIDEWTVAKNKEGAPQAWVDDAIGFEEWFADQFSVWASRQDAKATNEVQSFFKRLGNKLRDLFKALSRDFQRRFGKAEASVNFEEYMNEVTDRALNKGDHAIFVDTQGVATFDAPFPKKVLVRNMEEAIEKDKAAFSARVLEKRAKMLERLTEWPVVGSIFKIFKTADGILRNIKGENIKDAGKQIADMFEIPAQTGPGLGMFRAIDLKTIDFQNKVSAFLGDDFNTDENQAAFEQAFSDEATSNLPGKAKEIRNFLEFVYDDYIAPSNTTINKMRDYFPTVLDLEAIAQDPEAFIQLILANQPIDPKQQVDAALRAAINGIKPEDFDAARLSGKTTLTWDEYSDAWNSTTQQHRDEVTYGKRHSRGAGQVRNEDAIRTAVTGLVGQTDGVMLEGLAIGEEFDPRRNIEEPIQLTKNIPRSALRDWVIEPEAAFLKYLKSVAYRVEWNTHTKDAKGVDKLEPLLSDLDSENRSVAEEVINSYLGYNQPMDKTLKKMSSWMQVINAIALLPFAVFASLSDLAGPLINSKEFGTNWNTFGNAFHEIMATWNGDNTKLAMDINVASAQAAANSWFTHVDSQYMDPTARAWNEKYFRVIGLDWFTRFSRQFAGGMGKSFLLAHAHNIDNNPESTRYLAQLGVTADEVLVWEGDLKSKGGHDFTTPEGQKVKAALQRFVESSILRPNPAQRPLLAADPRFALIWQLKSFFYAFHKTTINGIMNEMKARDPAGKGNPINRAALPLLALTAIATMPLAMVGLELREYTKAGLSFVLPGTRGFKNKEEALRYRRSNQMGAWEYSENIFDRAGFYGIFSIFNGAHRASGWGQSGLASILGPTAETIDALIKNGIRIDRTFTQRINPIGVHL